MKLKEMFKSTGESVKKVDGMKVLGIVGTCLGIAASIMSNASQKKEQERLIEEKVAKALAKKNEGVL